MSAKEARTVSPGDRADTGGVDVGVATVAATATAASVAGADALGEIAVGLAAAATGAVTGRADGRTAMTIPKTSSPVAVATPAPIAYRDFAGLSRSARTRRSLVAARTGPDMTGRPPSVGSPI